MDIATYIKSINEQFRTGIAREHSYRPMLQQLLNEMLDGLVVTNEPARIDCGAPDFIISSKKTNTPVFYIEAKDIDDRDLDGRKENKEQFNRYKKSLDHIIFTDYLDFHLYENGEWVRNVRLAEVHGDKIDLCKDSVEDFKELINHIATTHPTPITTAKRLAEQMAAKARILASTINNAFRIAESEGEEEDTNRHFIQEYAYRPFDKRFVYYDTKLIERPREILMKNFIGHDNIALLTCRQIAGNEWSHVSIDNHIIDDCRVSNKTKERGYVFPLYLYTNEFGKETKVANLNDEEWQKFNNAIGRVTSPEELLAYIYAVLHSPSYRERYKEFLKVDFPRIPLPTSESEFVRFAQIGQQLINLHMMRNTQNWKCDTTFPEPGSQQIDMLKWKDKQVWINKQQYFGNVPEEVWDFYIGGYQPAQKWLKDRKGRTLVFDDIKHYLYIIHALAGTIKLMQKI